ncbi:MAG: lysine--tRNA ligase [Pseudomonadota bacterium]|jgi:lysyl-tRNA synthetase class 2
MSSDKQALEEAVLEQEGDVVDQVAERANRLAKLENFKQAGIHPYPARFEKAIDIATALTLNENDPAQTAGRLMLFRQMGKITFAHLQDFTGRMQVIFKKDVLGDDLYKLVTKNHDLGDYVGVEGTIFTTKTGEKSILVSKWTFLGKALLPPPGKFHGVKDKEILHRKRYLDLMGNAETRQRFAFRSRFIRAMREFYWSEGFHEVETSTLTHKATGAAARPYHTHNNALDIDLVLRISHELPLKELVVGGFERVFELGKAFRNEGHDPSHLPEHTHLEHYVAYWSFEDNIRFTERMFDYLFDSLNLPRVLTLKDRAGKEQAVDWSTPWPRIDYIELVNRDSGLDVMSYSSADALRADIRARGIEFEGMKEMGLTSLIDNLYKKVSRPNIIQPTILYNYPKILQPLARVSDLNSEMVDQFQMVVNGWEIVKAYSELVDPIDQRERFEQQAAQKEAGDEEAFEVDEEYLVAMEHGMPPISGWGMGVDRVLALLTGQENLRDVVLFPLMRPE